MQETAEFNGSLRLDESNLYLIADPDDETVEFGENYNIEEDIVMILTRSEAYLLYQMLERSLLFLSHQR